MALCEQRGPCVEAPPAGRAGSEVRCCSLQCQCAARLAPPAPLPLLLLPPWCAGCRCRRQAAYYPLLSVCCAWLQVPGSGCHPARWLRGGSEVRTRTVGCFCSSSSTSTLGYAPACACLLLPPPAHTLARTGTHSKCAWCMWHCTWAGHDEGPPSSCGSATVSVTPPVSASGCPLPVTNWPAWCALLA
jgi:hypothetical protein